MSRWLRTSMVFAIGLGWAGIPVGAQTFERETKVTGPGGRSITRDVTVQRGPGYVDRNVQIQRPGGTFDRNVSIQRGPGFVDRSVNIQRPGGASFSSNTMVQRGFAPPAPGRGFIPTGGFRGFGGPREVFVERPVIVGGGGGGVPLVPALLGGAGLFGLGMLTGSALNSPPPPPVVAGPPPVVVYNAPQPYTGGAAPVVVQPAPTVVVDPVADAITRMQSFYESNRKEGALTLGRLRDPRAVAPLVDRLKNDSSRHVRAAAATALGEIGDPQAKVFLERATIYDKRQEVRDAAALALAHLPRVDAATAQASAPVTAQPTPPLTGAPAQTANVPWVQGTTEQVPPNPQPEPSLVK